MTELAAIIADFRRAVALLAELGDPAATRAAGALSRWLAGAAIEAAAGLPTDWRWRMQIAARELALVELARLRADLDPTNLADWIVERLRGARREGIRRDGALGYVDDLARAGCGGLGRRNLRRLLSDIQAGGQRDAGHGHDLVATSAHPERHGDGTEVQDRADRVCIP